LNTPVVKSHADEEHGLTLKDTPKAGPLIPTGASAEVVADDTVWKPVTYLNEMVSPTFRFTADGTKTFPAVVEPTWTVTVADCPQAKKKIARTRKMSAVFAMGLSRFLMIGL